jgi:hypothetical protein
MKTIRQILAITWLNLRNLPHRLGSSLVAVVGVAAVVLVFAAVLSNPFLDVLDALTLVRFGRTQPSDLGGHLTQHLPIVPLENQHCLAIDFRLNALRQLVQDGVGIPEIQLDGVAFHLGTVADSNDFQSLAESRTQPGYDIGQEITGEAVQRTRLAIIAFSLHGNRAIADFNRNSPWHLVLALALRSLDVHHPAILSHLDTGRDGNWNFAYS